jgi:hypothetical protein
MASPIEKLGEIPDPRRGNAQRHALLDILTSALAASVCGAESCVDFAEFAQDRETLLRKFLSLKEGLPSHDIFSRVCRLLDPAGFARAFEAFPDDLGVDGDGVLVIAGQDAAPLLRPGGGTLGAARGHRLRQRGAGGDRPAVLREVPAFFADPPAPLAVFETTDADHGRIETRRHRISRPSAGSSPTAGIACVEATRTEAGKTTRSTRCYPSSAKLAPETFARAVRGHRAIENSLRPRRSTSPSTRTAPATAATTAPRTSPSSGASPSIGSTRPAPECPSPEAQPLRLLRRLRKNNLRPNAIDMDPDRNPLAFWPHSPYPTA